MRNIMERILKELFGPIIRDWSTVLNPSKLLKELGWKTGSDKQRQSRARGVYNNKPTVAKDGHPCASKGEACIDNALNALGIDHEIHPQYPFPSSKKADWKIRSEDVPDHLGLTNVDGDIYIEYFGSTGDPKYDKNTAEKRSLAREKGMNLVEIYPSELPPDLDSVQVKGMLVDKLRRLDSRRPLVREQRSIEEQEADDWKANLRDGHR